MLPKEDRIVDINKVKSIYDITGCWFWKDGICFTWWTWNRSQAGEPFLENKDTGETIKGLNNIRRFIKNERFVVEKL